MKKMLIIQPALAPYIIDEFNALSQQFDLEVIFLFANVSYYKFDQRNLLSHVQFKVSFLLKGPHCKERVFRFGILKAIRRVNPDIILGYEYSFTIQYLFLLKRMGLIHQKIGSMIDDSLDICNHAQSATRFFARQISVKKLDYLIVLSNEVSKFYQNKFNLPDNRIIVSPLLQEPKRLRCNPEKLEEIANEYVEKYKLRGKKVLLFVGRFVPVKALNKFIDIVNVILREQDKIVLVLVGEGEERKNIEANVKDKNLESKVLLPGRFDGKELYAWYLCASGFVLPSINEAFGAVVNEALIFGTKVFCSQYAGASSIIQPDCGMIFNPLDETETVKKLNEFFNSIDIVDEIDMMNRPSLMVNTEETFNREWAKLAED